MRTYPTCSRASHLSDSNFIIMGCKRQSTGGSPMDIVTYHGDSLRTGWFASKHNSIQRT